MRVQDRAGRQVGLDEDQDKKIILLCLRGKPPPFQSSEWGLHKGPVRRSGGGWGSSAQSEVITLNPPQRGWIPTGKNLLSGPGSSVM